MKKLLLTYGIGLMALLFSGCASNTDQITDINVAEENNTSEIVSENETPNHTIEADVAAKMKDAAALCFENVIDDAKVKDKIGELIINENQFIIKMDTDDQPIVRVYIVQEDSDKEYGYIILNKYTQW